MRVKSSDVCVRLLGMLRPGVASIIRALNSATREVHHPIYGPTWVRLY